MTRPSFYRSIILLWLAWAVIVMGFQALVTDRVILRRPDPAVFWSAAETTIGSQKDKPYLNEPFLNQQVSWDSEFYLSIAVGGYDDPDATATRDPDTGERLPLSYAFFPAYPYLIRAASVPLRALNLNPIAAAALAGVGISLLGTLAGLFALWDLAREGLGEEGAFRAAFYLLAFPTAFFLAMVYTEGLFVGLAFGSLALARRGNWLWASVLAALAAGTRATGAALVLPLAWTWFRSVGAGWPGSALSPRRGAQAALAFAPVAVFLLWQASPLGQNSARLDFYFGRGFLQFRETLVNWQDALEYAATNTQSTVYYGIEIFTMALALVAGLALLRFYPAEALFSLAAWALAVFSGVPQSLSRYMLVLPATYLFLAQLGRSRVFDRAWTLASVLLLGMSAMLFAVDLWVG
jgi:hypothetical protein